MAKTLKITILTQYYPPEHGAPQNRLHDLAKRWVSNGHTVTVMTAMPNYPNGAVFPEYKGKFTCRETIDNVNVIRSAIFASKKKSTFVQLTVYFSFVISAILVGFLRLRKQDYLICESPPLFLGISAVMLSIRCRSKLVMNVSDLWPESAVQLGIIGQGAVLRSLERFEKFLYYWSWLVSCQTEGIVEGVKRRYPKVDTFLFPNGVDLDMFHFAAEKDPDLAEEYNIQPDHFIVGYGGNHGRSQALSQVLEAAKILRNQTRIYFFFFGDGPEKDDLVKYAQETSLGNVKFFPSQPREKMTKVQSLWDVALVPLKNIDLFDGARPSKMFELMAGGIPFLFCGRGEGADIAVESGCGIVVPPEEPAALAEKILDLSWKEKDELKQMSRQGRKFVTEKFNRAKLAEDFMTRLTGETDGAN